MPHIIVEKPQSPVEFEKALGLPRGSILEITKAPGEAGVLDFNFSATAVPLSSAAKTKLENLLGGTARDA